MKTIFLLFATFFIASINALAQICTDNLNSTYGTSTSTNISIDITATEVHCSPNNLSSTSNNTLTFVIKPNNGNTITFDSLNLSSFGKVIFKIEKAAKIYLKNSTFDTINKVEFQYKRESLLYNFYITEYFITNNKFLNHTNLQSIETTVLNFKAIEGESIDHRLDNVNILENEFYIGNNPSQCPSSCGSKVVAIGMNRTTSNQDIKNITISNNTIIMKGQRVLAIDFAHDFKPHPTIPNTNIGVGDPTNNYLPYNNFDMTQNSLYATNKNIYINKNIIKAESSNPHYGIMIQGPYDNVDIKYNSVIGFGLNSIDNGYYFPEGAIDLYGSRNNGTAGESSGKSYYYSNNIKNAEISYNYIKGPVNGIRLSGGNSVTIHKNDIEITDWASDVGTGNIERVAGILIGGGYTWGPQEFASTVINVTYNSIALNNLTSKVGIGIQSAKDFHIQNNTIDQLKSVGIYYYSKAPFNEDAYGISIGIGSSSIINNTLDYESNSTTGNSIASSAWGISVIDTTSIALYRDEELSYYPSGESLNLSGNSIETSDPNSYDMSNYDYVKKFWLSGPSPWPSSISGQLTINQKSESSSSIKHITSGDFDGDGLDEYVIRSNDNEYFIVLTDTSNNPNFAVQHWSPIPIFWGDSNHESKLKAGDINGDGKDDLIFLNKNNTGQFKLRIALSTGGSFQQFTGHDFSTSTFNTYNYLSMAIGNFDGDDSDEIAIRTPTNDFYVIDLVGATLNRTSVWADPNISGDSWYEPTMHSGDFNEDGYDDLFFLRRNNNGKWMVRVMVYDVSNSGFDGNNGYDQTDMDNTFGSTFSKLASAVGDFDGDGDSDMMIRHPNDTYYVLRSNGSATFSTKQLWKQGYMMWGDSQYPIRALSGNVNGDSRDDLFIWSQANDSNVTHPGHFFLRAAGSNTNNTFSRFFEWELEFDSDGGEIHSENEELTPSKVNPNDGIEGPQIPDQFQLLQNYPNPFNPTTNIEFGIPEQSMVSLQIFDITGRLVKTLVNETKSPGRYTVSFDAFSLSSGIYIYQLSAGSFTQTKKLTLIK